MNYDYNTIKHLLVVDDDIRIRKLLVKYLSDNNYFTSSVSSAEEAEKICQEFKFDLIILDVMMPEVTGIEFAVKFRKKNTTPILMLTAASDIENRIKGLENGADDYLAKPFEPKELLLRIKNIISRAAPAVSNVKNNKFYFGNFEFNPDKMQLKQNDNIVPLTSGEEKLLYLLGLNANKLIDRDELAALSENINSRSIDVQITRLRNKIEKNPKQPVFLKTIRGKGYILYTGG